MLNRQYPKALHTEISEELHLQFKEKCVRINRTMTEILNELIRKWIAEDKAERDDEA